jgi:hypothetical protein
MTEKLTASDLRRYAVLGAEARLLELDKETASIYQSFPELRKQRGARSFPVAAAVVTARAGQRRRRRTMSAAQRAEVAERMRRYWAQRRSASAQGETAGATREGTAAARKSKAGRTAGKGGRRKMSAAARKRISDAQKARWAKRKKANV